MNQSVSDSPTSDSPTRVLAAPLLAAAVLAAWTLFVWSNRITNVLNDDGLEGWAMTWRLAVAVVFVVLALASAFAAAASRFGSSGSASSLPTWGTGAVSALAMASILWWPPRTVSTLVADFSVAFKVVHVVLAVVSVGLGVWALRTVRAGSSRFLAAKG